MLVTSSCHNKILCSQALRHGALFRGLWPGCEGVVRPAPEGAGRMMQSKPALRSGFNCIIRPAPSGAGQTTPSQPGHYSHYNTKLTNSRHFQGNSHRIALIEPQSRPSCSCKSSEHCYPLCTQIKAIARIVLNEGHKLTCLIRCMCLRVFSPCVDLCLIPNELL